MTTPIGPNTNLGVGALVAGNAAQPQTVKEAADAFEAVFIAQMLQHMFSGIKTDGPFGGGEAEGMFRDLLTEEYGATITRAGGIGIAASLQREMLKLQEVA